MIQSVITICTANICRSPVAEAALQAALPDVDVSSAGLHALVGRSADKDSAAAAQAQGIVMHDHSARQFNRELGSQADLILVMETHHRQEIAARWPQFLGKTFLLGQFADGREVPDPYKRGIGMHHQAVGIIAECCGLWRDQIEKMKT
jgi:protein-tyrosine phosphatase